MRYSETVDYKPNAIGSSARDIFFPHRRVSLPFRHSALWRRLSEPFDVEHFMNACPPVDVGHVPMDTDGMQDLMVLRCPIKASSSMLVTLPTELDGIADLVRHVCELEAGCNAWFELSWCHVSFQRTLVQADTTQRVPGWHVDGFQGVRVPRHRAEHSYLWSDRDPTEYCVQPFFLSHLDPGRHNVFDEISRQARDGNAYTGLPGHAYLIDPYLVHRSPRAIETGYRSFARITFTETEFEDPANTVNLSLGREQNYAARIDARDRLHAYGGPVPWEFYGVAPVVPR